MKRVPAHRRRMAGLALLLAAAAAPLPAAAEDGFLGLDWKGSLGEGRHSRYVPPLTNPVFNETPYITTELRGIYMYNEIPDGDDFVTDGGNIHLGALQLRVALTERLGFIATKDGYADANFNEVLDDESGFANIAFGLKYAILSDPESESILTAGLRYELPIAGLETGGIELQGHGNGFINPFVTGATTFGDLGLQASLGANVALDTEVDTSILHYSLHADYEVFENFFPLIELNGFTPIDHGNRLTGALGKLDGIDLLNFGSDDRGTTITAGGGFRYRFTDNVQIGVGIETPLTDQKDTIMEYRAYGDIVISF